MTFNINNSNLCQEILAPEQYAAPNIFLLDPFSIPEFSEISKNPIFFKFFHNFYKNIDFDFNKYNLSIEKHDTILSQFLNVNDKFERTPFLIQDFIAFYNALISVDIDFFDKNPPLFIDTFSEAINLIFPSHFLRDYNYAELNNLGAVDILNVLAEQKNIHSSSYNTSMRNHPNYLLQYSYKLITYIQNTSHVIIKDSDYFNKLNNLGKFLVDFKLSLFDEHSIFNLEYKHFPSAFIENSLLKTSSKIDSFFDTQLDSIGSIELTTQLLKNKSKIQDISFKDLSVLYSQLLSQTTNYYLFEKHFGDLNISTYLKVSKPIDPAVLNIFESSICQSLIIDTKPICDLCDVLIDIVQNNKIKPLFCAFLFSSLYFLTQSYTKVFQSQYFNNNAQIINESFNNFYYALCEKFPQQFSSIKNDVAKYALLSTMNIHFYTVATAIPNISKKYTHPQNNYLLNSNPLPTFVTANPLSFEYDVSIRNTPITHIKKQYNHAFFDFFRLENEEKKFSDCFDLSYSISQDMIDNEIYFCAYSNLNILRNFSLKFINKNIKGQDFSDEVFFGNNYHLGIKNVLNFQLSDIYANPNLYNKYQQLHHITKISSIEEITTVLQFSKDTLKKNMTADLSHFFQMIFNPQKQIRHYSGINHFLLFADNIFYNNVHIPEVSLFSTVYQMEESLMNSKLPSLFLNKETFKQFAPYMNSDECILLLNSMAEILKTTVIFQSQQLSSSIDLLQQYINIISMILEIKENDFLSMLPISQTIDENALNLYLNELLEPTIKIDNIFLGINNSVASNPEDFELYIRKLLYLISYKQPQVSLDYKQARLRLKLIKDSAPQNQYKRVKI